MLETRGAVVLDDFVADLSWAPDSGRLAVAGGEGKVFLVTRPGGSSTGTASRALQAREVGEHPVARRLHVGEQLLHQLVVMVGELFQHGEARLFWVFRRYPEITLDTPLLYFKTQNTGTVH